MRFRLFDISITIQPSFWILALLFCFHPHLAAWQMLFLAIAFVFSLLFHEYGHALAAQRMGKDPEITLEGFGGFASYDGRGLSQKQHFIITLCGPLFTLLLIAIPYFILKNHLFPSFPFYYFLHCLKHLNSYWLIVNLAPLSPLDGGKMSEYLLKKWLGAETGERISFYLGMITAVVGFGFFLIQGSYLFAYIFVMYGLKLFQSSSRRYQSAKPSAFSCYQEALFALEHQDIAKAKMLLERLIKSKDLYIKIRSVESLAELLDREGDNKKAYALLNKVDAEKLNRGKWLLCKLAYTQGNYALIEKFSLEIYQSHPTLETALLNAKAFAHLNSPLAIEWLKTALQFEEAQQQKDSLLSDPDLAILRNRPEFAHTFLHLNNPSIVQTRRSDLL